MTRTQLGRQAKIHQSSIKHLGPRQKGMHAHMPSSILPRSCPQLLYIPIHVPVSLLLQDVVQDGMTVGCANIDPTTLLCIACLLVVVYSGTQSQIWWFNPKVLTQSSILVPIPWRLSEDSTWASDKLHNSSGSRGD